MDVIYHDFPVICPVVTMETPAPGRARGATPAAPSASGAGRTAAGAALQVCPTSRRRGAVSCPVPRDTTGPATAGAVSRATPAAEPAQVTKGSASSVLTSISRNSGVAGRDCAGTRTLGFNTISHTSTPLASQRNQAFGGGVLLDDSPAWTSCFCTSCRERRPVM